MRKLAIIFIFFALHGISQKDWSHKITLRYSPTLFLTPSYEGFYSGFNIGYALERNNKASFGTLININSGRKTTVESERMVNVFHALFCSYRPLAKSVVSPKLHCEFGYQIVSNGHGKYIDNHFALHSNYPDPTVINTYGVFKNFGPYGSCVLSLSTQIKMIEVDFGIGYINQRLYTKYLPDIKMKKQLQGGTINLTFSYRFGS